ncbi:RNA 2',3'-cyclic phosphodiesterase [Sphingomonas sp. So64.6b]|uniref:RNA 2',3'-cyclic phosphodiesterase n=1 Tax=Sphingomonas sp. So64.6b TaxID=2997354 RepID=UPI0016014F1C|nr:RNA 2',3'-cyclic phosphodiesterase [Sphingomonas sp. So64.6b]QNA83431.1 RNA 2',3'-cyclic phosphodiesterase [Sphingomonas sp. So64.6b]
MHRLFVALRPPPPIRETLDLIMDGVPDARWQDDEQLHLTLRYIGKVDRHMAEDIAVTLGSIQAQALDLRLSGVGRFDPQSGNDSLWAGVLPHEPLAALHRKIDHALVRCGLPPEGRAYRPHITLARLSRRAGQQAETSEWLAAHSGLVSEPFAIAHIILYESHLDSDAAHYEPIGRWPLG